VLDAIYIFMEEGFFLGGFKMKISKLSHLTHEELITKCREQQLEIQHLVNLLKQIGNLCRGFLYIK